MPNFKNLFSDFFVYREKQEYEFSLSNNNQVDNIKTEELNSKINVHSKIKDNLTFIRCKYNSLINSDIVIREFNLIVRNKYYKSFLVFIDGLIDSDLISNFIMKPLMIQGKNNTQNSEEISNINNITIKKTSKSNLENYIYNSLILENNVTVKKTFNDIISSINSGNCALFIDTLNVVFDIDVKNFKQRSIDKPTNEIVIRGSQEAFVENLRTNTSMLRRTINNENFIVENTSVGSISKTKIAICYLKNIANDELVAEIKFRINNLDIDYLLSSGQLEQLIQDNKYSLFPQMIATERVDKCSNHILEGKVAVIVNGSPYILIMPAILTDLMSSPEDINLKFQFANLLKFIRIVAVFFALLLPGLYVAITNYHQELIPTELLFAIAASRESVPFPIIFEILLMEISFELIREAGLRVPSPIGFTISIVGAIILGDAAVSANLVSPILIIVVAITGICSFAIPSFSLNFTIRLLRFVYIFLGYIAGLLGIALGIFIQTTLLFNLKSFGVPFLIPYLERGNSNTATSYFVPPAWKREYRASYVKSKKSSTQNKVSMLWRQFGLSKK